MSLPSGTRLGPYEILGKLGAGGMGEVYRARDGKLSRDVAIKVLPAALAQHPDARARFEREAQAVAALSHPNVVAIHDYAVDGTTAYAVTELLEGQTLRARMREGVLPVRKAVEIGIHIVRGVAAAHERGIIHRDLKPENVFLTRDGLVKILDFGLAKDAALAARVRGDAVTQIADTNPGTVLGTVGYMSPEQVRGQALDHRTDVFSFGATLYEMLTGRRAFHGDSQVETMNAILKEDPPEFAEVNPSLPVALDRIVRRCLEKQPADRFHSAHDLAIALEALSATSNSSARSAAAALGRPRRRLPLAAAIAAVLVTGAAAFFAGRALSTSDAPAAPAFQRLTFRRGVISSAAFMPDGDTVVYAMRANGERSRLYSARTDNPDSAPLPYERADVTSISSKGELALIVKRQNVFAFANPGVLQRASLNGAARDVLENVQDADWLPDGSSLAVGRYVNGKFRLEFPIGKMVYETTGWVTDVRVSRDGASVAFLDHPILGDDRGTAAVIDASGRKRTISAECETAQGLAWGPAGDEVWFTCARQGLARSLEASTLDGRQRTLLRVPASLKLAGVAADGSALLWTDHGRRGAAALLRGETRHRDVSWFDWTNPVALSEDGTMLLLTEEGEGGGPGYGVYLRKLDGSSPAVRIGSGNAMALSADGKWVIARTVSSTPERLMLLPTGVGEARPLTSDALTHENVRFLPDGTRFLFVGAEPGKAVRTWVQGLDGGAPVPITPEGVIGSRVTPDGKAVITRKDGVWRFYPIDGKGEPQVVGVIEGNELPIRFTSDGRAVLIRRPARPDGGVDVVRVDLATGARTPVRTVMPVDDAGGIEQLFMTSDGAVYVQGYGTRQSDLFLVRGLR